MASSRGSLVALANCLPGPGTRRLHSRDDIRPQLHGKHPRHSPRCNYSGKSGTAALTFSPSRRALTRRSWPTDSRIRCSHSRHAQAHRPCTAISKPGDGCTDVLQDGVCAILVPDGSCTGTALTAPRQDEEVLTYRACLPPQQTVILPTARTAAVRLTPLPLS